MLRIGVRRGQLHLRCVPSESALFDGLTPVGASRERGTDQEAAITRTSGSGVTKTSLDHAYFLTFSRVCHSIEFVETRQASGDWVFAT